MKSKGTVMHVITGLNVGGAETMLAKLVERSTHNSIVVSLRNEGILGEAIKQAGTEVFSLNLSRDLSAVSGLSKLAALMKHHKPDVIQTWLYAADLLAGYVASQQNVPLIWNIRQSETGWIPGQKHIALNQRINAKVSAKWPSSIVYCGQEARRTHESIGYSALASHVIGNGVDTKRFSPDKEARAQLRQQWLSDWGAAPDTRLVGIVGRIDPLKNHDRFLRLMKGISARFPQQVKGVMVGRGVDENNSTLCSKIKSMGLSDTCKLLGERSNVNQIMNALDMVVLTSDSEGWPNVLGEAMACAKVCVSTDVGDVADLIGNAGFVNDVNDEEGLLESCCEVLSFGSDKKTLFGQRARQRIVEGFSLAKTVKQYDDLYSSYLNSQEN